MLVSNGKEVAAPGEKEAQKPVDVFVGTTLPGSVRLGEINRGVEVLFQFSKGSEFCTIIKGNTVNRDALERLFNR